jgi:nucleoside phosphorylase
VAQWEEHDDADLPPYLTGVYDASNGGRLPMALARPTRMGGRSTGVVSTSLTDHLKPTCLAMSGVCAGNPDDTAPGDVVVAAPAYEYDEGKYRGQDFQGDHQQYPQDDRWLRAAQDFDSSYLPSYGIATEHEAVVWFLERLHRRQDPRTHPARRRYFPPSTWQPRLERLEADGLIARRPGGWGLTRAGRGRIERILDDDVDRPEKLPFVVHAGPMASGSAVIQDPQIWTRLKQLGSRKVLALEMEAASIATVANARQVPHWLVAKGVMDRADFEKDDRFKEFAARASAEVLYALLGLLLGSASQSWNTTSPEVSRPSTPPVQLHAYYRHLERQIGVVHEVTPERQLNILAVLANWPAPLTVARLAKLSGETPDITEAVLRRWAGVLDELEHPEAPSYALYHTSFRDYLAERLDMSKVRSQMSRAIEDELPGR